MGTTDRWVLVNFFATWCVPCVQEVPLLMHLARQLGIKVVAEAIEEAACLAFLKTIGCDYAQGYFVSRPLPADELAALVSRPAEMAACQAGFAGQGCA